jgi:hypothetical protein
MVVHTCDLEVHSRVASMQASALEVQAVGCMHFASFSRRFAVHTDCFHAPLSPDFPSLSAVFASVLHYQHPVAWQPPGLAVPVVHRDMVRASLRMEACHNPAQVARMTRGHGEHPPSVSQTEAHCAAVGERSPRHVEAED